MILAILITILPTILLFIVLPKIGIRAKSNYLQFTLSWFAGIYLFTFATFFIALFYSYFTSSVLMKASISALCIVVIMLLSFHKEVRHLYYALFTIKKQTFFKPITIFMLGFCFLFSSLFLAPHLAMHDGNIYTSEIYWDFHWHAAIIQNFVYGDNFPVENESFSGTPMTYHFFGDLVMAIFSSVGLSLTDSVTYASILFFFVLLLTIIGCCEEFFHSLRIGFIAVLLTITTSSGHFLYYLFEQFPKPFGTMLIDIIKETSNPWYLSYISGNPFHYNGTMFNLFYFVEERHMFLASIFLLLSLWIIYQRKKLTNMLLVILGLFMGAFFYWHVFIVLMPIVGLSFLLLFDRDRKETLLLLSGCLLMFLIQYVHLKQIIDMSTNYLQGATHYPQININFAVESATHSLNKSLADMAWYYSFAYGLKLLLGPLGIYLLWKKNKRLGILLTAFIAPIFLLINTLQISPSGVGENHKFLLNMNILLNVATAYTLYRMVLKKGLFLFSGYCCLFLLTFSGLIEHMPFINSKPTRIYSDYSPASLTMTIRNHTNPKATIIGKDYLQIQLAGRKLYVGESAGPSDSLNKQSRIQQQERIYYERSVDIFCALLAKTTIDFIEYDVVDYNNLSPAIKSFPSFSAYNAQSNQVIFLDVSTGCKKYHGE